MSVIAQMKILWQGDSGYEPKHLSVSRTPFTTTPGNIFAFVAAMSAHTLCNPAYKMQEGIFLDTPEAPGTDADVDKKVVLYFRDSDDLIVYNFSYPSPIAADIEDTPWGKRVKPASVADMVDLIQTAMGKEYDPLYGVYFERR